jgi:hypothetical protein
MGTFQLLEVAAVLLDAKLGIVQHWKFVCDVLMEGEKIFAFVAGEGTPLVIDVWIL